MKSKIVLASIVFAHCVIAIGEEKAEVRRLPVKEYRDKMQGAWLGQMIGVGWGMPTEFKSCGKIIPAEQMPPWQPEMVNQYGNDDCYVEMTFLKTLEDYGLDVSIRQAGIDFANSGYELWHANDAGRKNLRQGIAPPDSGHPKFNQHSDDIDYQIESDFAGIVSPGLSNQAVALGDLFGRLVNYGDGVYAGQFVAALYSEAFFEADRIQLIQKALHAIPSQSQYAEMVRDMLRWYRENPNDWEATWMQVEKRYHADANYSHALCSGPGGKDHSSIDVKLNGAYILMGLLYGNGDPDKTITIACRCGQDSDCNPSNAAGILFTMQGASKIPPRFTEKLDRGARFSHSDYTLQNVYEVSEKLARLGIAKAGGRIEKDASGEEQFVIPVQTPKPSQLESSSNPGPIDNVRYSAEEMARITAGKPVSAALPADKKTSGASASPVSIIFDTDIGNDIDDALALGLIHALESLGECKLLAVTVTKDNRYAAPFVDLVNTFYGRGQIPIGVVRKGVTPDDETFIRPVATAEDDGHLRYPHKLLDGRDAPEATGLLRKLLAAQPDGSVAIVQVGFSTNLDRLLDSKADAASPLDGSALVKQKVRLLSVMGGCFTPRPDGSRFGEYNIVTDLQSAKHLFQHWPTPIVVSGYEVGESILYPASSIEKDYAYVSHHPVAEAYGLMLKMPYDRQTWDLTSVLYAVRPDAGYFGLSPHGRVTVGDNGATQFQADANGPHRFLTVNAEQRSRIHDVFVKLCSRRPDSK